MKLKINCTKILHGSICALSCQQQRSQNILRQRFGCSGMLPNNFEVMFNLSLTQNTCLFTTGNFTVTVEWLFSFLDLIIVTIVFIYDFNLFWQSLRSKFWVMITNIRNHWEIWKWAWSPCFVYLLRLSWSSGQVLHGVSKGIVSLKRLAKLLSCIFCNCLANTPDFKPERKIISRADSAVLESLCVINQSKLA